VIFYTVVNRHSQRPKRSSARAMTHGGTGITASAFIDAQPPSAIEKPVAPLMTDSYQACEHSRT
jgi:hypothetical protein